MHYGYTIQGFKKVLVIFCADVDVVRVQLGCNNQMRPRRFRRPLGGAFEQLGGTCCGDSTPPKLIENVYEVSLALADHLTQLNHDLHSIGTIICQSCDLQPACHSSEKVLFSTVPCAALKGPYLFPRA